MASECIYGVVVGGIFYSNRVEIRLASPVENGIYSMDMEVDDFQKSIAPANIEDARKFFSKASKIKMIRGISFHDGIIPENPVSYSKIPVRVTDATYDELEEIEVVFIRGKVCYYLQTLSTPKSYVLMDLQDALKSKKSTTADQFKGLTPEIRIAYTFHIFEREEERKRKEMLEPINAVRTIMAETGAVVKSVVKINRGYEVVWSFGGNTINTMLDKNFRVIEAGFCVSGYDKTQSAKSVVNLLKDYKEEGSRINLTRTID